MKLLILSDLHLEWAAFNPPAGDRFDAVILAGDICTGPKAVRWAKRQPEFADRPVVLVPGNHEFYGLERQRTLEVMRNDARDSNVHVLDRDELVLPGVRGSEGAVRILGATLRTDFAVLGDVDAGMTRARFGLNDFAGSIRQRATGGMRLFSPADALAEHLLSRTWLSERLRCASLAATVVVTHHAPSARSIAAEHEGNDLNPCFVSELPAEFFERPALWVHGHVHQSFDYRIGRTRVVANPRGYFFRRSGEFENDAFQAGLVIDTAVGLPLHEDAP